MEELEAGLLLRGQVRNLLEEMKWRGDLEGFKELKSLLSSRFLLRGLSNEGRLKLNRIIKEVNA